MKPDSAIVVTGAASGIGAALTRRLLDEGHLVCACDVAPQGLARLDHPRLIARVLDVRDHAALERAVADTAAAGDLSGLVTCAAVFETVPFLDLTDDLWDETFAVNLKGSLFAIQAALPVMRRRKGGSIVLFSSMIARTGAVAAAHYAASKGGVLGLARALALETARDNIRVNVVSPGITDTPQPRHNMSEDDMLARAAAIPLGRIGRAEDMVEAALFLLRDDAAFVTGQDIRVNGGRGLF